MHIRMGGIFFFCFSLAASVYAADAYFESPTFQQGLRDYEKKINRQGLEGTLMSSQEVREASNELQILIGDSAKTNPAMSNVAEQIKLFASYPYSVTRSTLYLYSLSKFSAMIGMLRTMPNQTKEDLAHLTQMAQVIQKREEQALQHAKALSLWADQTNAEWSYAGGREEFKRRFQTELKGK